MIICISQTKLNIPLFFLLSIRSLKKNCLNLDQDFFYLKEDIMVD